LASTRPKTSRNSATSAEHPTWAQPVQVYFRRQADGWTLVGFERLPDGR
jgi:hypothetical protein